MGTHRFFVMPTSQTLEKVGLYESEEEAVLREEVLGCLDAVRA